METTTEIVKANHIKDLNVTLEQLYNKEKQVTVYFENNLHPYTLVLIGRDNEPDFMLSSFTANYYTRSNKGMNRQRYTTLKGIETAVKRLANERIETTEGAITYSVSTEIFYM